MKKLLLLVSLAVICLTAGAQNDHSKMMNMGNMKKGEMQGKQAMKSQIFVHNSPATKAVISNYISLQNALAADNGTEAATSGKALFDALSKINPATQAKSSQKELADILDDAKENAEHISKSGGDIDHQREHFSILGKDIKDLIAITGADRTLYQLYCPMYNKDEGGAIWLSDSKEVKNPYLGHKMSKCGSVQQEIALK